MKLYAHPFSSYCQKVLIALRENETPFEYRILDEETIREEHAALWPLKRFPLLVDEGRTVPESSIIIEYLALNHPGPVRLIPDDPRDALDVRLMDRFFDNYIMTPMQTIVFDRMRAPEDRDNAGVANARSMLEVAYRWLDQTMNDREWAAGGAFSMADCAAAPSLFYADWTHPIADEFGNVRSYRERLLARPSVVRVVDDARPYRSFFPLGAPDRD
ncbi:glutathione S-transferase domain-containing protein [Caballeronia terrestris]|uniref:Glutathione S-transferase domain-containing protein n=1 Tax=Caballeronia terrestris TaxID=1226301 RepID=A0A158FR10_9BURK|nr:glutathione S-transferase family protein [Caballeronia terrestris]SAL22043.1 glutathione S-transferase domain-containing protein [Caballeronia terrestris]